MIKIAIIGGGPAGLSAAIYASRAIMDPVVFAPAGGQLTLSPDVCNYPGFPDKISGFELIERMQKQALNYGAKFIQRNIDKVDFSKRPFRFWTGGEEFFAESIIVATGSSAKWLGVPGEYKFRGKGVSACATCDAFFFKDKKVAVIGGGDTAIEDSLFLSRFASEVTVIHRRDLLRAKKYLQDKAFENNKITMRWNSEVKEFEGEEKLERIKILNNITGETSFEDFDGAFIAIGHHPNTEFLEGQLDLDENGYILIHDFTRTSVEGVFAAGDVADSRYMQVSVVS